MWDSQRIFLLGELGRLFDLKIDAEVKGQVTDWLQGEEQLLVEAVVGLGGSR